MRRAFFVGIIGLATVAGTAYGQTIARQPAPGEQKSRNVTLVAHLPMGGPFSSNDIEFEREPSRPYIYVSGRSHYGFKVVSTRDVNRVQEIWRWTIENPQLHDGRATAPAYFKIAGRYYLVQSFQFRQGSPDADMGAVVMDMTSLPDTAKVREVARIRYPERVGGFHEIYSYKHSSGSSLLFAQVSAPWVNVYDMSKVVGGAKDALAGRVPNPTSAERGTDRGYHDMYVGYDPVNHQDRFYGAGGGGYYVYDVTDVANPRLITSATGIAGLQNGHTFTPTPDGRYAVLESEYRYAPLRFIDLKPGYDGTVKTISRPIGAYTARWDGLPHNHAVRWPYVFISHYEDGLRVVNMMDPTNPYEVAYYDTYDGPIMLDKSKPFDPPTADRRGSEQNGADGIDVRNWDGMIAIGDLYTGLWLFKMDGFDGWNGHQWGMPNISDEQDWDNGPDGAPRPQKVS